MADLKVSAQVTLDAAGTGSITLGPGIDPDRSSLRWLVAGVVVKTSRPGQPPIPRVQVVDQIGRDIGVSYDGTFDQGPASESLTRGEYLTATWTGGQAGDIATISLTGTKS